MLGTSLIGAVVAHMKTRSVAAATVRALAVVLLGAGHGLNLKFQK
jgi:hypothetical protein